MSYCLIAQVRAAEGNEDAVAAGLAVNQAASRLEPGVIEWIAYRSKDDPRNFLLYEIYVDAAGLEAHRASEHFRRYVAEVVPLLESREFAAWEPLPRD
ncbi:MAG TPA: putative quinol monooxygenase [Candidatus Limnocylindrales bacterium]|nr:putative quinol monooxygenase [Candidatus Limnocylindrales bacterium]